MSLATVDPKTLYRALDQKRGQTKLSWRELATKLELSPSTFTRMAQGRRPDVDSFATLLQWLNMPVERFMRPVATQEEEEEPLAVISTYLRSARNIRPEDAEALDDIITAAYRHLVKKQENG